MIIGRYNGALHNISESCWEFKQLSSVELVDNLKSSIKEAETYRITNPVAIDIMQSQITTLNSLKETMATCLWEETKFYQLVIRRPYD